MNLKTVTSAMSAARAFLEKAEDWQHETNEQKKRGVYVNAPKQSGAVRRSSMELTRALAEMRKPG